MPDRFCEEVGTPAENLARYGLDAAGIAAAVTRLLEERR